MPNRSHVGYRIAPKSTSCSETAKSLPVLEILLFFNKIGGPGPPKSIKNPSKNEVNMGRHLGIDFSRILVDFWSQVGRQNGTKIDPNRHRKTMQKRRAPRWPKSRYMTLRSIATGGFQGAGEVPPFKAGQTPGSGRPFPLAWSGRLERPSRPDLT